MTEERDDATTTGSPPPVDAGELLVNGHRELEAMFAPATNSTTATPTRR